MLLNTQDMWIGQVVWFICVVMCTVCALSWQPLGGLSQYELRSALSIHIISSLWGLLSHCAYTHTVNPSCILNQGAVLHLDKCLSVCFFSFRETRSWAVSPWMSTRPLWRWSRGLFWPLTWLCTWSRYQMSSPDGNLSGEGWRRGKREEEKVHLGRGKGMEASGAWLGHVNILLGQKPCFFFTSTVKQRSHSHCHPRILIFFISSHFEHHTIKL